SVDLPQPLGPTIATKAPRSIRSDTSRSAQYVRPSGVANSRVTPLSSSIEEPRDRGGDRVGRRRFAVRAVAGIREDAWVDLRRRASQRVDLARLRSRIARAVDEQRAHAQVAETAAVEIVDG